MKTLLILLASAVVVCAQTQRFQIITAQTESYSAMSTTGGSVQSHTVFKLDTQTGQTWVYFSSYSTNGVAEKWLLVENSDVVAARKYLSELNEFIAWAKSHPDGSEAIAATSKSPSQPAYTAEEIAKALAARTAERDALVLQLNPPSSGFKLDKPAP